MSSGFRPKRSPSYQVATAVYESVLRRSEEGTGVVKKGHALVEASAMLG